MPNRRTRVFGALVAVVLAAAGFTGFGASRTNPSTSADSISVARATLAAEAAITTDTLRGDKVEARRLLTDRFALAVTGASPDGSAEPSFGIPARLVVPDASPAPGLSFGRAPPLSR